MRLLTIFLLCLDGPGSASVPAALYTQFCPSRWQYEHTGLSPGHLDFFRLCDTRQLADNNAFHGGVSGLIKAYLHGSQAWRTRLLNRVPSISSRDQNAFFFSSRCFESPCHSRDGLHFFPPGPMMEGGDGQNGHARLAVHSASLSSPASLGMKMARVGV